MLETIHANSLEELNEKMIGYNHDHCYHYYNGTMDNLPLHLIKFKTNEWKYIFIYKEY
jgi:hypothetical protein